MTRDLTSDPAWTEDDLGRPLPDSSHACSVCLPTWDSIVGYEEGREKILRRMRTGYPRFFKHLTVERLFENARAEIANDQEQVAIFPTKTSVQRAHRWVEQRAETALRITSYHGLQALVFPEKAKAEVDAYWRFSGEVISSRQAQDFLDSELREGSKSRQIAKALAPIYGSAPDHSFVFSSGMAAITAVLRSLPGLAQGKKTLQIEFPYVDGLKAQEHFGNGAVYLNEAEGEPFDEALKRISRGEFAGVFTEAPSNPLLRTADLKKIAEACAIGGTPLIVDDSACGPSNVDALPYADVVTGSLTKWISGEGDVMAGMASVAKNSRFAQIFTSLLATESESVSPLYIGDAEVLISNIKGYPQRMDAINANGRALAEWLSNHSAVASVWHPSITTRQNYDLIRRKTGGYGGLLSFTLKNLKKTPAFYDALRLSKGPSFGTNFTLVCPYVMLAHYPELEWAEACGVHPFLIRVSCGREPIEYLIKAFETALNEA